MENEALEYLKKVVPVDLIPRMKTQGFLRGATISLILQKYPLLSIEKAYSVIYFLTGQEVKKVSMIKMGKFYMKGNTFIPDIEHADIYSEEEIAEIMDRMTDEVKKRVEIMEKV